MGDSKRLKSEEGRMSQTLPLPPPPRIKSEADQIADLEKQLRESSRMVVELRRERSSTKDKLAKAELAVAALKEQIK